MLVPVGVMAQGGAALPLDGPFLYHVGGDAASPVVADLNGDGLPDVGVLADGGRTVRVLLQQEGAEDRFGAFRVSDVHSDRAAVDVEALDADGDGRTDLLLAAGPEAPVGLMRQGPGGAYGLTEELPFHADWLVSADVNDDGALDVLAVDGYTGRVLRGEARGLELQPSVEFPLVSRPRMEPLVADLNGDAALDFAYLPEGDRDSIRILFQTAEGAFVEEVSERTGELRSLAAVEWELGGRAALAGVAAHSNALLAFEWQDGAGRRVSALPTTLSSTTIPFPAEFTPGQVRVAMLDTNGDGREDAVVASDRAGDLLLLRQTRGGSFERALLPSLYGIVQVRAVPAQGDGLPTQAVVLSREDQTLALLDFEATRWPLPVALDVPGKPLAFDVVMDEEATSRGLFVVSEVGEDLVLSQLKASEDGKGFGAAERLLTFESHEVPQVGLRVWDPKENDSQEAWGIFEDGSVFRLRYGQMEPMRPHALNWWIGQREGGRPLNARSVPPPYTPPQPPVGPHYGFLTRLDFEGDGELDHLVLEGDLHRVVGKFNVDLGDNWGPQAIERLDVNADGRDEVLVVGSDRAVLLSTARRGGELRMLELQGAEGEYGLVEGLEMAGGGSAVLAAVEMRGHLLEFWGFAAGTRRLERVRGFQVFSSDLPFDAEQGPQPRAVRGGDLDGDGQGDVIAVVHDKVAIYYGEAGD